MLKISTSGGKIGTGESKSRGAVENSLSMKKGGYGSSSETRRKKALYEGRSRG